MPRAAILVIAVLAVGGALWYLRDPAWLIGQSTGLRQWEQSADGTRYRWSGKHASFFVPADAAAIRIPVSTTFDGPGDPPMLLVVTVDDRPAARLILVNPAWQTITVTLPPRGSRRVRRIDIRTNLTRDGNHGVRVGDVE